MPPKTPARQRVDELLADGAWHDRDTVIAEAVGVVPPGVAARRARRDRTAAREYDAARAEQAGRARRPGVGGRGPGDDVRVGARSIVRDVISSAVDRGALQRRRNVDRIEIRLAPTGGE